MNLEELWFWFKILFVVAAGVLVIYYIFTSGRRYNIFIQKKHSKWKNLQPDEKELFSIFLIGDAGAPSLNQPDPVLSMLKKQLDEANTKSAVFFLGDNVYPRGLPEPTDPSHKEAELRLVTQLEVIKNYVGHACFITGNHDWNKGRKGGYEAVLRQQAYIEAFTKVKDIVLPRNGCPGPVKLDLKDDLLVIIINTQWWVHDNYKPIGEKGGCEVDSEHEFFIKLQEILDENKHKKVLVVGHHPMYSMAAHGGHFHLKQHLFPLTELHKKAYVPMPGFGSIYPIFRRYIGHREDMAHPKYKNLRKRLTEMFKKHENLIYAAGHDHNLQYIKKGKQHYLVSGAGSKVHFVKQGGSGVIFAHAHRGFMRIDFFKNETWLEIWEPEEEKKDGKLAFTKKLF